MIGPALTPETHAPQPVRMSLVARPSGVPAATIELQALVAAHTAPAALAALAAPAAPVAPAAPKKLAAPVPPKVRTQVGANSDPRNSGRGST
jgi:hypothetical protein